MVATIITRDDVIKAVPRHPRDMLEGTLTAREGYAELVTRFLRRSSGAALTSAINREVYGSSNDDGQT